MRAGAKQVRYVTVRLQNMVRVVVFFAFDTVKKSRRLRN